MSRFAGKVAIVTGGAGGIGFATARRLTSDGAKLVLADLRAEDSERAVGALAEEGADVMGIACDVGSEAEVEGAVRAALDGFGRVDIVVNCAGMMLFGPLEEFTSADWQRVFAANLFGAVHFTRQAFLTMKGGAIVNVASVHAERTSALVAPYAAAKAALVSLTRSAAIEGAAKGIPVNAVLPGAIDTPMLWDNPNVRSGSERFSEGEVGRPEDVASAIAYLASDDGRFITGAALLVDGDRLARL